MSASTLLSASGETIWPLHFGQVLGHHVQPPPADQSDSPYGVFQKDVIYTVRQDMLPNFVHYDQKTQTPCLTGVGTKYLTEAQFLSALAANREVPLRVEIQIQGEHRSVTVAADRVTSRRYDLRVILRHHSEGGRRALRAMMPAGFEPLLGAEAGAPSWVPPTALRGRRQRVLGAGLHAAADVVSRASRRKRPSSVGAFRDLEHAEVGADVPRHPHGSGNCQPERPLSVLHAVPPAMCRHRFDSSSETEARALRRRSNALRSNARHRRRLSSSTSVKSVAGVGPSDWPTPRQKTLSVLFPGCQAVFNAGVRWRFETSMGTLGDGSHRWCLVGDATEWQRRIEGVAA